MKKIVLFAIFCGIWGSAVADNKPSMFLDGGVAPLIFGTTEVRLSVEDRVGDDCMPRPDAVKNSLEAGLRRSRIGIGSNSNWKALASDPLIEMDISGYTQDKGRLCIVQMKVSMYKRVAVEVPYSSKLDESLQKTWTHLEMIEYNNVLSGSKVGMQNRLERESERMANEIYLTIERARDEVRRNWPELWGAYMSSQKNNKNNDSSK